MTLSPFQAVLLSLFVPGSVHMLMGRTLRGVVALVSCLGLFFLGYSILGDRLWLFRWFPPFDFLGVFFTVFPLNMWPEWPNLGCTMLASFLRETSADPVIGPNLQRAMYLPVPHEQIAFFCTAASGVLSAIWSTEAYLLASHADQPRSFRTVHPTTAALTSWFLPGSGHYLCGQKDKGFLVGGAVIVMFVAALLFSDGHAVDRVDSPAYFIATVLFGAGTLFTSVVTAPLELSDPLPAFYECGATLALVAGLMNLVVIVDAYTIADNDHVPVAPAEASS
ncbi:MAG: DUF6677 family protein [Planctomycetota bacterium]|jgi:hypothetical protein